MNHKLNKNKVVCIPTSDTLDLHNFRPSELKSLVHEYLEDCFLNGIFEGRIIHGKGIGTNREIVHAILKIHPKLLAIHLGLTILEVGDQHLLDCLHQTDFQIFYIIKNGTR